MPSRSPSRRTPVDYASDLAELGRPMYVPPVLVPAFAEPAAEARSLTGSARTLFPNQTPHLRVGWLSLAAMLALIASALGLVACGTRVGRRSDRRALSDAERVKVLKEAREAMPIVDDSDLRGEKPVRILGTVRNEQGESLPFVHLSIHSQAGNSGYSPWLDGRRRTARSTTIPGGRIRNGHLCGRATPR